MTTETLKIEHFITKRVTNYLPQRDKAGVKKCYIMVQ